jgi:hypothetical protein
MTPLASRSCLDCGAQNPLDATLCVECHRPLAPLASAEASGTAEDEGALPTPAPTRTGPSGYGVVPGRPRRPPSGGGLLGSRGFTEEPGKVIPRRRHARVSLFGIGGTGDELPGGAPSWIWFAVAGAALAIAVIAAIGITSQKPPFAIPNATPEQAHYADSLARVLDRDSLDLAANVGLGNVLYDTHNFGEAVRYYRRALVVRPDLPDVRVDMATSLHQSGRSPEAIAELEQVIAAHPGHALAWFNLGIVYESVGRLADAEAAYRSVEGLPLGSELRAALARQLAGLGQKRRAAARLPAGP